MLLALLLALTIDPAASDSAITTPTTTTTPTTATTATTTTPAEPVSTDTPQGVGLVLPKVLPKAEPLRALRFVWRDHPSLRGGRNFRLDFSVVRRTEEFQGQRTPDVIGTAALSFAW